MSPGAAVSFVFLGLAACTTSTPLHDSPRIPSSALSRGLATAQPLVLDRLPEPVEPLPAFLRDLPLRRGATPERVPVPDLMQGAFPSIEAELDMTRGRKLEARLAELPLHRRQLGVAGLTPEELYGLAGDPPLCREPRIRTTFRHDGERWEAELNIPTYLALGDVLQPDLSQISPACVAALDEGPLEDALGLEVCADGVDHHFWPGSDCRACLDDGIPWTACETSDRCFAEAPHRLSLAIAGHPERSYGTVSARMLACAPDALTTATLLYRLDDARPVELEAFDFDAWVAMCVPVWSEARDTTITVCSWGDLDLHGDMVGAGVLGRAHAVRPVSEARDLHQGRVWWSPSVDLGAGFTLEATWLHYDTLGNVASPGLVWDYDQSGDVDIDDVLNTEGGWGLEPYALRPGGTDPSELDDTYARDFLGAMAVKLATQYDGVNINPYIFNRCAEGAWETLPDGRSRCHELGPHHLDPPLLDDALTGLWEMDDGRLVRNRLPVTTLASTGLPDRTVPGGFLVDVRGSTSLAKPGWEDCAWPQQFEPDLTVLDEFPWTVGGQSPMVAQTYRFGREGPGEDAVRIALNTGTARDFCPGFQQ